MGAGDRSTYPSQTHPDRSDGRSSEPSIGLNEWRHRLIGAPDLRHWHATA